MGLNRTTWMKSPPCVPQNRLLEQKRTFILFIPFDNFFEICLAFASLLLWNMNAISRISIKNSITYPKQSQIRFVTGALAKMMLRDRVEGRWHEEEKRKLKMQHIFSFYIRCMGWRVEYGTNNALTLALGLKMNVMPWSERKKKTNEDNNVSRNVTFVPKYII